MGSLEPQGPVAEAIAQLWWLMLAIGVAVFVVFAALLTMALLRRGRPSRSAGEPSDRWILVWGAVLPLVILAAVFVATLDTMRAMPTRVPPDALTVEIVGHRWWYQVHYPAEGVTVTNELHLPVGRPVALVLTSADVIHSFWVPELGGKMDMLPEDVNVLVLQADRPGQHRSLCAEFCGLHHADMRLTVVAEPAERFDAWVAEQR